MSRTWKTAPHWVRKARREPGLDVWKSSCGSGCPYCGLGQSRRAWGHRATRAHVRRELNQGRTVGAYDDVHPVRTHVLHYFW